MQETQRGLTKPESMTSAAKRCLTSELWCEAISLDQVVTAIDEKCYARDIFVLHQEQHAVSGFF